MSDVGVFGGFCGGFFGDGLEGFGDGDGQAAGASLLCRFGGLVGFGEELGDFGGGGVGEVGGGGGVDGGGEVFQEGGEFELGEEGAAGGVVDGLSAHEVEVGPDGDGGVDGDEFFREEDVFAVVLERLAVGLSS